MAGTGSASRTGAAGHGAAIATVAIGSSLGHGSERANTGGADGGATGAGALGAGARGVLAGGLLAGGGGMTPGGGLGAGD